MRLNAVETALMNNPIRAAIQRRSEAERLLAMGGRMHDGRALEVGCGRGVGVVSSDNYFCRAAEIVDVARLDP